MAYSHGKVRRFFFVESIRIMIVGTEWLIEATGCDAEKLRDLDALQTVFARVVRDLNLKTIGEQLWHHFPGAGGVTGLTMLTESHLACHTYPEHETATFNLYCCRARAEWNWEESLRELLGAESVDIRRIERGVRLRFAAVEAKTVTGGSGR